MICNLAWAASGTIGNLNLGKLSNPRSHKNKPVILEIDLIRKHLKYSVAFDPYHYYFQSMAAFFLLKDILIIQNDLQVRGVIPKTPFLA